MLHTINEIFVYIISRVGFVFDYNFEGAVSCLSMVVVLEKFLPAVFL